MRPRERNGAPTPMANTLLDGADSSMGWWDRQRPNWGGSVCRSARSKRLKIGSIVRHGWADWACPSCMGTSAQGDRVRAAALVRSPHDGSEAAGFRGGASQLSLQTGKAMWESLIGPIPC